MNYKTSNRRAIFLHRILKEVGMRNIKLNLTSTSNVEATIDVASDTYILVGPDYQAIVNVGQHETRIDNVSYSVTSILKQLSAS